MSDLPSSVSYMTQATRNGNQERESFHKFFECWIVEQDHHLHELVSASKDIEDRHQHGGAATAELNGRVLRPLLERVVQHYEHYYSAKSRWAKNDILSMFNPTWRSSLEDAFLWIGGWRPSMAFHLLYSKSGLQLEARGLDDLILGLTNGDLSDLSTSQLGRVDELQKVTLREEKEITEKLAKLQETVADSSMVELSHAVSELIQEEEGGRVAEQEERVEAALAPKEEGLVGVLEKADELRMKTLKGVIDILSPTQGVHFLIAAAELHLRVHDWGKKRDARHHQVDGDGVNGSNGHHRQ
ncbi:hypothetical protein ABFS83_08G086600 [Erythranthe nasuta]